MANDIIQHLVYWMLLATLLKKKDDLLGKRVGLVICGGNISLDTVRDLLN